MSVESSNDDVRVNSFKDMVMHEVMNDESSCILDGSFIK